MAQTEAARPVSPSPLTYRLAMWYAGALMVIYLCLPTLAAAEVHPYDRWAKELGIDMNVSYDGMRVMEFQGGTFEAIERRAPGKMYAEVNLGGMTSGVILREDLQKSYILMPSMGFYKEESLEGGMLQAANGMEFNTIEKIGSEDVNGHPSTKYKTSFKDNEGKGSGLIWVTDTGVPIKMDMTYSSGDMQGQRISMQFTELNLRKQDPKYFELPANLKPMNMGGIGDLMKMGTASQGAGASGSTGSATGLEGELSEKQQACLEAAAARAAQQREEQEATKGFGRLMGSITRTAQRFGLANIGDITRGIYGAEATADDVSAIADELGITEEEVQRCRQP